MEMEMEMEMGMGMGMGMRSVYIIISFFTEFNMSTSKS